MLITSADASFYMHEVSESTMMKNGIDYDTAHEMAIKKYNVSSFSIKKTGENSGGWMNDCFR
ncbi:hypothetical protein [Lysinibacillus sphaericus]|uniref:hypothetical protein n=1 Tax=Lysinibacillus sphaericus TaxID=1421 RepID=UPI0012BCF726